MAQVDTDVLIIGAGSSGVGLGIQLQCKLGHDNFTIIEKGAAIGGTWLVNTYPGCGCDVASHFYSYSFALNPSWNKKFSLQPEIRTYFENVAKQYDIPRHIRYHSTVDRAVWSPTSQSWHVSITDHAASRSYTLTARSVVSSVGGLSVPRDCEIEGHETFKGKLFHSARWDQDFDWAGKNVVVLGNGCSATQFVPILTSTGKDGVQGQGAAGRVTQFSRQAHYLAERENPYYSEWFKAVMRWVPGAMRLYRFKIYADMERDFAGFYTLGGKAIREDLKKENEAYVKRTAPEKYWDAVIPKHEIGCKRKVLDTDYLACLWRENMDLVAEDPVDRIVEDGVVTKSGRKVEADAIVLATGFQTSKLLFPMEIMGEDGISLQEHWEQTTGGSPAAYLGTMISGFPNFFITMGPNTVTGHLSVIYAVECQLLLITALLRPILSRALSFSRLLPWPSSDAPPTSVAVTRAAGISDTEWTHNMLKDFVWSSGCTSWALDPKTGVNIAMYPHYQWHYWLRSLFLKRGDFRYALSSTKGGEVSKTRDTKLIVGFGWTYLRRAVLSVLATALAIWARREARRRGMAAADVAKLLGDRLSFLLWRTKTVVAGSV